MADKASNLSLSRHTDRDGNKRDSMVGELAHDNDTQQNVRLAPIQDEPLDLTIRSTARADNRTGQHSRRRRHASESQHDLMPGKRLRKTSGSRESLSADAHFKIVQDTRVRRWKTGVEEKRFAVKFNDEKAGTRLIDVRDQLVNMFDAVIKKAAGESYSRQDKARMSIFHGDMNSELFVHLQDLENLTGEAVMNRFERVLNSHEEMSVDSTFEISVGLLRMKKGGGKTGHCLFPHLSSSIHSAIQNKRSIVEIVCENNEHICAAKALAAISARKCDRMSQKDFDKLVKKGRQSTKAKRGLRQKAINLLEKAHLPTDRALTIPELAKLEPVLKAKILVVTHDERGSVSVIEASRGTGSLKSGQSHNVDGVVTVQKYDRQFYLYHVGEHFHAIMNPRALFFDRTICPTCFVIYQNSEKKKHSCVEKGQKCFACGFVGCISECEVFCGDCNIYFKGIQCYNRHLRAVNTLSLCEKRKRCTICDKVIYAKTQPFKEHVCGTYKCRTCCQFVDRSHLCYLRRKKMKKSGGKFLFFDFESVCDRIFQCREHYAPKNPSGCGGSCQSEKLCNKCRYCTNCHKNDCGRIQHQPNMVVSETCCDSCEGNKLEQGSTCINCGDLCDDCYKAKKARVGGKKKGGACFTDSQALGNNELLADCEDDSRGLGAVGENNSCLNDGCGARRVVFKGLDTVYQFCEWLFTPKHSKITAIAHFGKGYDFMFLLNWLLENSSMLPECIFSGSKLMSLKVGGGLSINCIDSLNFLMTGLKNLPKAFGLKPEDAGLEADADLTELAKLDFPYRFNTRDRWDYEGPYPGVEMYDLKSKSTLEQQNFLRWHASQEGKIFNLQKQLEHYCVMDTTILRLACMTFRRMIIDITRKETEDGEVTYVDPFAHLTMASCVMQIFRLNHIQELFKVKLISGWCGEMIFKGGEWFFNGEKIPSGEILESSFISSVIPQLPAAGYVTASNHSCKSIQWLEYKSKEIGRKIIHARNTGEHRVRCGKHNYSVDGYDPVPARGGPKGTVYEFLGCFYHGHVCLKGRNTIRDPRTGFNMKELDRQTKERLVAIEGEGYAVKYIYECKFDKMLSENEDLKSFIDTELDVPPRMTTRMAFYGGRTSGFKLHSKVNPMKNEEIHYLDVCSLYPYINKYKCLPLGHPRIITADFDLSLEKYYGMAHVKVLPPQNDYIGRLPYRALGKLHFPLCRICCETSWQGPCSHNESERCLHGVWCTPELMYAIQGGYKIVKIYEVYHYDQTSQYDPETGLGGLFAEQVDLFLKLKAEASGYPSWVQSESDEVEFVSDFEAKSGVKLDQSQIAHNPALRSISKLSLNAFWGKLAQRPNMGKTVYIRTTEQLHNLMADSSKNVLNFHIVNEDILIVEYNMGEDFVEDSFLTNNVLAAFTTCNARLELMRHIHSVGVENILYADTDSIIFKTHRQKNLQGEFVFENFPAVGDSLGELTNELPDNVFIEEFCCSGPKSYAFRRSDNIESCKFKGVTLHDKNKKRVNFESVKELVFGSKPEIALESETQFHRCKTSGVITNVPLNKTIKCTFSKRRILPNLDSVPYGYKGEHEGVVL